MPEKKILIVDADVASRNFITRILIDQQFDVIQAGSGKEGLICAWRDHPDLAILDPNLTDLKGEDIAIKLRRDVRTANMPLIALSSDPSISRIKSCLDAGYSEYITKSGQAVQTLNETISRFLGLAAVSEKKGGTLMMFLSAKGGTGTSSICANTAMNISKDQPDARVVVVDLVLPIGSIASIVGYEGTQNIVTITDMPPGITTPKFFKDELPDMNIWGFNLLAGSPDPESSNQIKAGRIWEIIIALKESYDYVLIDIGRSLSKITFPLLQKADVVALIISTDISAISLTKTLWEYLLTKGLEASSVYTILNRAVGLEGLSKVDVEKTLGIPVMATLPYLSSNFSFANSNHQPFTLKFPRDSATFIFVEVAKEMISLARKLRDQ